MFCPQCGSPEWYSENGVEICSACGTELPPQPDDSTPPPAPAEPVNTLRPWPPPAPKPEGDE